MKKLSDFINEALNTVIEPVVENKINSEKEFKEAAKSKFEEVFGDELDEEKMNKTIDGILEDNHELVENGEWGELMGILNKSFADK